MAEVKQVTLKRFNGTDEDTLHPTTEWDQVENKPSTFTATAHTLNSHTDVNASPTDGQALVWDGTNSLWVAGEGGGGSASVTISATAPTSPEEGDLWWDSTDGNLYIYYNDGTSSQWVEASAGMGGAVDKADLQNLYIYGKASVAITKGQAIQFAGAEGDHILIKPAVQSEINANPDYMIGIADSDLSIGVFGYVIVNGRLTLDTSTYTMAAVSVSGVGTGEFVVRTMLLSREIHEVIGLQTALDGKAALSHTHAISDVTGLQTALDGKATPADITTAIDDLVDLAPGSLDTLNELAAALGDDANFASTVTTSLAGKSNVGHTHTKSEITDFAHTHDDRYYTETESDSRFVNVTGDTITGSLRVDGSVEIGGDLEVVGNSIGFIDTAFDAKIEVSDANPGGTGAVFDFFGDGVSRNATLSAEQFDGNAATTTKLATARNIALSGDVTGNANFDGSGNITISTAVANDSHTHDGRYYTEAEADSRFINASGDTMTGELIIDVTTANRMRLYTEQGTGRIADTFADDSTFKSYIYFDAGTNSNDPGYIMHETSDSETNEGVLHLVPSDDNAYGDYVSIHGTNDPDSVKIHTDGTFEGVTSINGITSTEISYLDGVTSGIQGQLNGKQAAGTYNTIIGTDSDINTSGSTIIDNIYVTDGVITSMGTRTLTLADLGYTGATNANYITNNNQLTNGAGYTTYSANQTLNTSSNPTFNQIYANGWFRNNQSGEGLYNQANAMHWYSTSNIEYSIYSLQNSTRIKFMTSGGNTRGYVNADNNNNIGFLDENGNWGLRVDNSVNTILTGGLVIEGSINSGGSESASEYEAAGTNIILKGDGSGRSGIFFQSERDGTNINHSSDFGYIQFHPYGRDGTSGEANELLIGVSNDSTDHLIFNTPTADGLRFRIGASGTDYNVWHGANLTFALSGSQLTITTS